ncbi:MAG: hypothetical protein ACXVXP_13155 [Mycobacteriaceae bacterium]
MNTKSKALVAVAALAAVLLLPGGSASAGNVSSGPLTLTVKESPFFVKGTQETLFDYCGTDGGFQIYQGGTVQQAVSATSPYGIASWDIATSYSYSEPSPWVHYAQSAPPLLRYSRDNYDDGCGGGVHNGQGFIVRVTDKHGNVAELEEMASIHVPRWDNTTAEDPFTSSAASFSFGAAWAASNPCSKCDNGSTIYTTKAGASAVYTLNSSWSNPYSDPVASHLGLIMTKGPGHGAVKLYLDGVLKATVNTYSSTWKYRNYVYDFGPLTPGAHTVKLVNVGTPGRPRIDVQGMGQMVGITRVPYCDPDTCT